MTQHTPGPWKRLADNSIVGGPVNRRIAWIRHGTVEDAFLIAAAPALLDALEAVIVDLQIQASATQNMDGIRWKRIADAKAALALARGEEVPA